MKKSFIIYLDLCIYLYYQQSLINCSDEIDLFKNCYDELGCIEVTPKWYDAKYRPVNLRPLDRHIVKTEFLFIKKTICNTSDRLVYNSVTNDPATWENINLTPCAELILLIHDFTGNGYTGWIKHIAQLLLSSSCHSYTIISVDWQSGAEPPLDQAIANARLVALEINYLLNQLKDKNRINDSLIHIIGHGLGAHIAGYVGMMRGNIQKITALDPTGIRFEGMPSFVRLNPKSASYVEVLHTDAVDYSSQGTRQKFGHVDFFINNAKHQPGCNEVKTFRDLVAVTRSDLQEGNILAGCSHKRSFKYYIEAMKNHECKFIGLQTSSYEKFLQSSFTGNSGDKWTHFGLDTCIETANPGTYYMQTNVHAPYCLHPYIISVCIKGTGVYYGYFDFMLIDEEDEIANVTQYDEEFSIRNFTESSPNAYVYYAEPPKLRRIKEAKVRWTAQKQVFCLGLCSDSIKVKKVTARPLDNKRMVSKLCPQNSLAIENTEYTTFVTCTND